MEIPYNNLTEEQILEAIEQVVNSVASSYKFGYHNIEDIKQEGRLEALRALKDHSYDGVRPLTNFLYVHVKNRLSNFKRNKFRRNDPPCKPCHTAATSQERHESKCENIKQGASYCKRYLNWQKNNASKQNIMNMLSVSCLENDNEFVTTTDDGFKKIELQEIKDILNKELSPENRKIYLLITSGETVTKQQFEKLKVSIISIFKSYNISLWNDLNTNVED